MTDHVNADQLSRRELLKRGTAVTIGAGLAGALPVLPAAQAASATSTLTIWAVSDLQKPIDWPAKFEAANPGIKVQFNTISYATADSTQKFLTAIAGGTPPDLIWVGRLWVGELAKQNGLMPLDHFVAKSKDLKAQDFFPRMWQDVHWNGKVYGIPFTTDVRAFYWNKELFKKAGLDPNRPPRTLAELEHFADKLTIRKQSKIEQLGFDPAAGNPPGFLAWYLYAWQLGGDFFSHDYRKATCNSKEVVQALTWMVHMADKFGGRQKLDALETAWAPPTSQLDALGAGKLAMIVQGNWMVETYHKYAPHLNWSLASLPLPPHGHKTNYLGGWSLSIPKGAQNPTAAWKFIEFMNNPQTYTTFCNYRGSIPTLRAVADNSRYLNATPYNKYFVSQLPVGKWVLVGPGATQALVLTSQTYDRVMRHQMSPQEGCNQLNQQMQAVLDARYR